MKNQILTNEISRRPVEFIVPHCEAMGLRFICIVRAEITAAELAGDEKFLESLRRAVTGWIVETPAGREAWAESCADFNIGDLANQFPLDEELKTRLEAAGIFNLQLESFGGGTRRWVHDTCLVDTQKLEVEDFEGALND